MGGTMKDDWVLPLFWTLFFLAIGYGAWLFINSIARSQEEAQCRKIAWMVQAESDLETARKVFASCMKGNGK